jgi:hypothetical protein
MTVAGRMGGAFRPRRVAEPGRGRVALGVCVFLLWVLYPMAGSADRFGGSQPLECTVASGRQFHANGTSGPFDPESVGLPRAFTLDFRRNRVLPAKDSIVRRQSRIKRTEHIENLLILQGADDGVEGVNDGVGWTMAIEKSNGTFVIGAAGDTTGYLVFGRCKVQP